jgi:hypothetical protein
MIRNRKITCLKQEYFCFRGKLLLVLLPHKQSLKITYHEKQAVISPRQQLAVCCAAFFCVFISIDECGLILQQCFFIPALLS